MNNDVVLYFTVFKFFKEYKNYSNHYFHVKKKAFSLENQIFIKSWYTYVFVKLKAILFVIICLQRYFLYQPSVVEDGSLYVGTGS